MQQHLQQQQQQQQQQPVCLSHVLPAALCPVASRFLESGGVFKLEFGPKAFIVVSDPVVVRHLLKVGGVARWAGVVCTHTPAAHSLLLC